VTYLACMESSTRLVAGAAADPGVKLDACCWLLSLTLNDAYDGGNSCCC